MTTQSFLCRSFALLLLVLLANRALAAVTELGVADWPLHFEANQGQTRDDVKFLARGPGYGVYLTANEALLSLSAQAPDDCATDDATAQGVRVFRMRLIRGAKAPAVRALDEQQGKANYFVGDDPSNWRTNIPTYAKVRYEAVYPGIDVVYYGNQRQLEYDFVLAPGADSRNIELQFDGADRVEIDASGDLVLHACGHEIRQPKPVVYQEADGRREVAGRYIRRGKNRIGFAVAAYDRSLPLTIDPLVLSYATYFGGSSDDANPAVAVDTHGGAYLTGFTGPDFPVTPGAYQTSLNSAARNAFVAKFDSAGSLIYSTYLGGTGRAYGEGIAVDQDGSAYVAGTTEGAFPTTPGAFQEMSAFGNDVNRIRIFVSKLDPTGSALQYSTLLAGHVNRTLFGWAPNTDIAVDRSGSAYVTSWARQTDFPTTPGAFQQDGGSIFVARLNATGSALVYSSVFAVGEDSDGHVSSSRAIALDREGNAYVTGAASTRTFPVTTGAYQTFSAGSQEAFVTKLSPLGELLLSTFLGSSGIDVGQGIAVDPAGAIYVTGLTTPNSFDFKITPRAYRTQPGGLGFVTKLNSSGTAAVYSTYLNEQGMDLAVDAAGRAYVTLAEDRFVTIMEPSGSWANLSGIKRPQPSGGTEAGWAIGRNPEANANLWVVGFSGFTDFPVTPNAYQPHRAGSSGRDTVVMKFAPGPTSVPGTIEPQNFDEGSDGGGYHDNTPGNQGDAGFRTGEDVDVFVSNDASGGSPYIVKNFEAGEWLAYTINVTSAGLHDIELRASTHPAFPNAAYHIDLDGRNVTGTVVLPDTGGWDHYQWLGKKTIGLGSGTHVLKVVSERAYFNLSSIRIDPTVTSAPYYRAPMAVPGVFEAEDFDAGGEGIGYDDGSPGNQGDGGYRVGEDVDIFGSNDNGSGSWYIVKNIDNHWLTYTINVPTSGDYDIEVRASTSPDFPSPAYFIDIDDINVTGVVDLPATGGWDHYQWLGKRTVALPAGIHVLKLQSYRPYFNLNSIRIMPTSPRTSARAYFGEPMAVPGVIEAEDFDAGGEGFGYHDHTLGNQGNSGFRDGDSVDIFVTNDAASGSAYIVKNFETGEWLSYTINVPAGGNYDVELRASTHLVFPNSGYHIEVDGADATGTIVLPNTGGWDNYLWLGKRTIALTGGVHVLTVVADGQYFDFNSLRVLRSQP